MTNKILDIGEKIVIDKVDLIGEKSDALSTIKKDVGTSKKIAYPGITEMKPVDTFW